MNNKLVQTTFTNIRFQNYEIESDKGFFIDGKEINKGKYKVIKTKDITFTEDKIKLESLALSLLKLDLNRDDAEISLEFTKKWGFLDFVQKFTEAKGEPYGYGQYQSIFEVDDPQRFIKNYSEPTSLWKNLSFYLHYLFYLKNYSLSQINNLFLNDDELPNKFLDEGEINFELSKRVFPTLGFKRNKLDSIKLETNSLYGAVLMFAIDNFYREIRQCMGPTCRQMFFVKRKGRKFCEPNGKCAKAFERLNRGK
jgi:hypothetical protein